MDDDLRLADQILSQGLCTRAQIDECLSILRRARETAQPAPKLEDLLVQKGYLTSGQTERTLQVTRSERPTKVLPDAALPREALEASANPLHIMGKYIRVTRLGAGGMGEVWRAWDRELRRWVALKFLKYDNPEEVARFTREAQTAGQLNHPNIASIYEVGEASGKPYIAMQYIEGQTFVTFPRQDPRLLVTLIRDAALAVHAAHEQRVIHRDLKPHNLIVEGKVGAATELRKLRVFVLDFGLAKQTTVDSSISSSGSILGTPAYMAPEQARGKIHEVDVRSDVYSLGATLYEVLADRPPFRGANAYEILKKVVEEDPKPLRRINPRIDPELEVITMKCLEKESSQRYGSALELAEDLTRWLAGEAIQAHAPSAAYRMRKFLRRHVALIAVSCAAILTVAGAAALLVPRYLRERKDRQRTEQALAEQRDREARERGERERARDHLELGRRTLEQIPFTRQNPSASREDLEELARRAIAEFEKAPGHPEALLGIGRAHEEMDRRDEALRHYDLSVAADPRFAGGYLARLRLFALRYEHLRHMVGSESPESEPLLQKIRADQAALRELNLKSYEDAFILAHIAFANEDYDSAEKQLEQYLRTVPGDRHALKSRSHALGHLNRKPEARTVAEALLKLDPNSPDAWFQHGNCAETVEEAIRDYTKAIEVGPEFPEAWLNRGVRYCERREFERALADFSQYVRILPGEGQGHYNCGVALVELGRNREAIRALTEAIRLLPRYAEAHYRRGLAQHEEGQFDLAIQDYTQALALDGGKANYYEARGVSKFSRQDLEGAEADWGKMVELTKSAHAYAKRGVARFFLDKRDAAYDDICEAIRLDPNSPEAAQMYLLRSEILEDRKDRKSALEDMDRAIRLQPEWPKLYSRRAFVRERDENYPGAVQDAKKYLELEPDGPSRVEMEDIVKRLDK